MKRWMKPAGIMAVAASVLMATSPAWAQEEGIGVRRFGVRGGLTVDPDQGHIGMHINAGNFADKVRFQPSFELGFGSDRIVGAINIDAMYVFDKSSVQPYLGGGLGVAVVSRDRGDGPGEHRDDVNVEAGLNLLGGMEWGDRNAYMLEARLGIGDIPDFKLTIGLNF